MLEISPFQLVKEGSINQNASLGSQIHSLMESSVYGGPSQTKRPAGCSPAEICSPPFTGPPPHTPDVCWSRASEAHLITSFLISMLALVPSFKCSKVILKNTSFCFHFLWPGLPINQGWGRTWKDWANQDFNFEKCLNINQKTWRLSRSSIFFETLVCLIFVFSPLFFFSYWPHWALNFILVPLEIFLNSFRCFLWGIAPSDTRGLLLVLWGRGIGAVYRVLLELKEFQISGIKWS